MVTCEVFKTNNEVEHTSRK